MKLEIEVLEIELMQAEIDELRAENAALLAANLDCILHYEDARDELEKLKQQAPAGFVDSDMEWFDAPGFCVRGGTHLFLAAGASK